jgi:hypothetical protein
VTAELNIHLEDRVSTKAVRRELHKSNIHGRAAVAKPWMSPRVTIIQMGIPSAYLSIDPSTYSRIHLSIHPSALGAQELQEP